MDIQSVLSSLVERSGVKTIYGDPVTSGEITVVPVAQVCYGFGGGSGSGPEGMGEGGGGGGGYGGRPVGYIEITAQGTRWVPIGEGRRLAAAIALGVLVGWALCRRLRAA